MCCYFCGSYTQLEAHHVFSGANRKYSTEDGFVVILCHKCHNEPPNGVHYNKERMDYLRRMCQAEYEKTHSHEAFMKRYGRNYL